MSVVEKQAPPPPPPPPPPPLPPVHVRRVINAPPADVFAAWTDPAILVHWYGAAEVAVADAAVDAREGGAYRIVMRGLQTGRTSCVFGTFTEFRVPERLAFTWQFERADGTLSPQSLVTVDLAARDGSKTEIRLTHALLSTEDLRRGVRRGWSASFDKLDRFFASHRATRG